MAGCFGNHPFDKAMERELMHYLNSQEEGNECAVCGKPIADDKYLCDSQACLKADQM